MNRKIEFAVVEAIPQEWAMNWALQPGRSSITAAEMVKAFGEIAAVTVERMKPKKKRSFLRDARAEKRAKRIRRKRERKNKRFR